MRGGANGCFCFQLSEALQSSTQNSAEVNLHLKLREDAQMRVEELEEALLEKDQEVQKLQLLVSKLQGEVRSCSCSRHEAGVKLLLLLQVLVLSGPGVREADR